MTNFNLKTTNYFQLVPCSMIGRWCVRRNRHVLGRSLRYIRAIFISLNCESCREKTGAQLRSSSKRMSDFTYRNSWSVQPAGKVFKNWLLKISSQTKSYFQIFRENGRDTIILINWVELLVILIRFVSNEKKC